MENIIVSVALLFVMLLLFMVVYDNNATLRGFLSRSPRTGRQAENPSPVPEEEPSDTDQTDEKAPSLPRRMVRAVRRIFRRSGSEKDALSESPPISDDGEGPQAATTQEDDMQLSEPQSEDIEEPTKAKSGGIMGRLKGLGRGGKKPDDAQAYAVGGSLDALSAEMEKLARRVMQAEESSGRIDRLEEALTKVAEDTQMLSEDFKDVLGSLRVTIDGLERRLAQVSAGQPHIGSDEALPDQGTQQRISQLETALETFNAAVAVFPQELQNVQQSIGEVTRQVENITSDLGRTLGYGIQKEFTCGSCGSEGLVASQVVCSQCGTGSMWGWWPSSQGVTEPENAVTDLGVDAGESGGQF